MSIHEYTYLMSRTVPTTFPKVPHGVNAQNGFPGVTGPLAVKCTQSKAHQETEALNSDAWGSASQSWSSSPSSPGLQLGAELKALGGSSSSLDSLLITIISGAWSRVLFALERGQTHVDILWLGPSGRGNWETHLRLPGFTERGHSPHFFPLGPINGFSIFFFSSCYFPMAPVPLRHTFLLRCLILQHSMSTACLMQP